MPEMTAPDDTFGSLPVCRRFRYRLLRNLLARRILCVTPCKTGAIYVLFWIWPDQVTQMELKTHITKENFFKVPKGPTPEIVVVTNYEIKHS